MSRKVITEASGTIPPEDERNNPSGRTTTSAAALALTTGTQPDVLPAILAVADAAARSGQIALAAVESCLAEFAGTPGQATATAGEAR